MRTPARKLRIVVLILIALCIASIIFGLVLFIPSTHCYDLSEDDARTMVDRILKHKIERSGGSEILFGYDPAQIKFESFTRGQGKKGDGYNSVEVLYVDAEEDLPLFVARIYETCEVEWLDMRR